MPLFSPYEPAGSLPEPIRWKVIATAECRRDAAWGKYFHEPEDAREIEHFLRFVQSLDSWPAEGGEGIAADFGFDRHGQGEETFFSYRLAGTKGERVPPLRAFFLVASLKRGRSIVVAHVVEERQYERYAQGVEERVKRNIRAFWSRQ